MNKVAQYLQDHLVGEVTMSPVVRQHFAFDAGLSTQIPQLVVAPKNETDIRKVMRFCWQLAERGKFLPIVARGAGTDLGGASIGQAISLLLTPHMGHVVEFDDRKGSVVVEPGTNFGRLQHMLAFSHRRYIPAFPSSMEYSSIGGAVVNNAAGERSLFYGPMGNYVKSLNVVLANGEVIETGRISKRELNKKMGLTNMEGEIYRAIDALYNENEDTIKNMPANLRSNAGYNLAAVKHKDGSIDLTPLFVGSQGTLGVVSQITLNTEVYQLETDVYCVVVSDKSTLPAISAAMNEFSPLACEYYDKSLLLQARRQQPNFAKNAFGEELPAGIMIMEMHLQTERLANKTLKKLQKKINELGAEIVLLEEAEKEIFPQLKRLQHNLLARRFNSRQLVPGIDDAAVPPEKLTELFAMIDDITKHQNLDICYSARPIEGIVHAYILADLSQLGDRQHVFRTIDDYYKAVIALGGTVSVEHGDGRIRGGYLRAQYGDVVYDLFVKVKNIFDPFGILNPGVKIDVDPKSLFSTMRQDYELPALYNS